MVDILIIPGEPDHLKRLEEGLAAEEGIGVSPVPNGAQALDRIAERAPGLVVVDENLADMTGLDFVRELVRTHPMVNCMLVSSLEDEAFHEASEGMGILMRIPVDADAAFAKTLLDYLYQIVAPRSRKAD